MTSYYCRLPSCADAMHMKEVVAVLWRRFYDWKTEFHFLGRYSVEKLQQFDRYQSRAGFGRCLAVVCVLSVLAVFVLLVGLSLIPVNSPESGVKQNVAALVRSGIAHSILTAGWGFHMLQYLGKSNQKRCLRLLSVISVSAGVLSEAAIATISLAWRYPITGGEFINMAIVFSVLAFSCCCCQRKGSDGRRSRTVLVILAGSLAIVVVFFILAGVFVAAPWAIQLVMILVHPLLRTLFKRRLWMYARKLNDLSTDVTLNLVDISAAMYRALCIMYGAHTELSILILVEELLISLAVAHTYSTHAFIVDGSLTLQTALKIVEGSLSSAVVEEEDEEDEDDNHKQQKENNSPLNAERPPTLTVVTSADIEVRQVRRSSSDTTRSLVDSVMTTPNSLSTLSSNVLEKMRRSASDPVAAKTRPQHKAPGPTRRNSTLGVAFQMPPKTDLTRRRSSSTTDATATKALRKTTKGAAPKAAGRLRRCASETMSESKYVLARKIAEDSTALNDKQPRAQSWARDPAKVYCLTDIRPQQSRPSIPTPKRPSLSRRTSVDLPPLGDLDSPDGFGRRPILRSSASVFLTPRTVLKHGSKRLLDLSRNIGRVPQNMRTSSGDIRKPSLVNIDGMLIVRKDQARILEQTLQLLFSCEVLIVAEFVRVLVPFLLGLLLATLWHLPSARYNGLTLDVSKEQLQSRILWCVGFAASELPPLVMVCGAISKKYNISPLHLLSFLLEQQYVNFQTKLMSCFLLLYFFASVHQCTWHWVAGLLGDI